MAAADPETCEAFRETVRTRADISAGLEPQIAALRRFHLGKRLAEIAFFVGLWAASGALVLWTRARVEPGALHWSLRAAGTIGCALALNAFILLLHEGMHVTLFVSRAWNRFASVSLGAALLMSFTAYKVMHIRHHNFLGDPRDPDDYENYTKRRWLLWCLHFVRLTLGTFLYVLLIPVSALRHGTRGERWHIAQEYTVLALVYPAVAWFVPFEALLHAWMIPLVLVGYMTNLRGLTQHGLADAKDPLLASRSIRVNRVLAFFLLNENYHLEHHLFPEIPSYNLGALHRLITPRLPRAATSKSYLGFLARFLRAVWRNDLTPVGVERNPLADELGVVLRSPRPHRVRPAKEAAGGLGIHRPPA